MIHSSRPEKADGLVGLRLVVSNIISPFLKRVFIILINLAIRAIFASFHSCKYDAQGQ